MFAVRPLTIGDPDASHLLPTRIVSYYCQYKSLVFAIEPIYIFDGEFGNAGYGGSTSIMFFENDRTIFAPGATVSILNPTNGSITPEIFFRLQLLNSRNKWYLFGMEALLGYGLKRMNTTALIHDTEAQTSSGFTFRLGFEIGFKYKHR